MWNSAFEHLQKEPSVASVRKAFLWHSSAHPLAGVPSTLSLFREIF